MKHTFRTLFKSPGFTVVAVATIGLAIGATTALFSVFNTLVLHPIDLPDAGRLVRIWTNSKERNFAGPVLSVPKFRMIAEQQTVFSDVAASAFNSVVFAHDGADPRQLTSLNVTANFLPTLDYALARGRNFTADEDQQNGPHVCLLAYDTWKTMFGKRDDIVGSTIQLDGVGTTVIGVLGEHMPAPLTGVQVVVPWPLSPDYLTEQQLAGGASFLQVTARLKPGVSLERAKAELSALSTRYLQAFPGRLDATADNELRTWVEEQVGPVRPTFVMLMSAVAFLLLIACANVSNLFLGRLSARHKEIAVRLSLGATRGQVVRGLLLESVISCMLAGTVGLLLAMWALGGAERVLVDQFQITTTLSLDGRTLAFSVAIAMLSSLIIGLIPSLQAARVNLADVLKDTARGTIGAARGARFRSGLIVVEVSLSVLLLIGSTLLLVSFLRLQSTSAGFSTEGIASAQLNPPAERYPTKEARVAFYYQVLDKLRSYPQIRSAAITRTLPLAGNTLRGVYAVSGRPIPPLAQRRLALLNLATEAYFATLHIPLRRGRLFEPTDDGKAPLVAVINESFAHELFPREDAIGKFLLLGQHAENQMQIVGIVADVKASGLNAPAPETIYSPLRQFGGPGQTLVASTDMSPSVLEGLFRAAVASVDKTQAVSGFATFDSQLSQSLGVQRVTAWLTGGFAAVALLLSTLGLYSVLAYVVTRRTGEIGLRMALGAEQIDVIGLVLRQGMTLVAIGLAIGLVTAAAGGRVLSTLLYGVTPHDPLVFGGVAVLFIVVAIAACFIPSWRASRIDALTALRTE